MVRLVVVLLTAGMIAHGVAGSQGRRRRQRLADAELAGAVAALGVVALEMRSGATPSQALSAAADSSPAEAGGSSLPWLVAAAAEPERAMELLAGGPPVLRALAAALRLSLSSGASLADLCERLAAAAAAEQAAARELSDGLAGARSTAALLTALPLAGVGFAALLGARPLGLLLGGSALGSACLILGVGLVRAGQSWTWRIVRRAVARATG